MGFTQTNQPNEESSPQIQPEPESVHGLEQEGQQTMNTSMDVTHVEEDDSMDTSSHGTEDLQVTLEDSMGLRKNLASMFEEEQDGSPKPQSSIRDKIAHFEQKTTENRQANHSEKKKPPATIILATKKESPNERLKVFLRVRPCGSQEASTIEIMSTSDGEESMPTTIRTYPPQSSQAAKSSRPLLKVSDPNVDTQSIKEYQFTSVLGPDSSQNDVFQKTTASLVNGLCHGNKVGKSALLFCYGVTGSGKTYTTIGDPRREEAMGILPRSLSVTLQKIANTDMDVFLSSFEIYNEQIIDLLPNAGESSRYSSSSYGAVSLKIRQGTAGRMMIPGLSEYKVDSVKAGLSLIRRAKAARHSETNRVNLHSSRSHSICQLTVRKRIRKLEVSSETGDAVELEESHLWIVDLAGNERTKRTNPAGAKSQREAAYINRSLMSLMRCLTSKTKPYRDSLLTMLFMHHWMNVDNSTTMIVNVNGAADDYDETQHVLSYAISSKTIPIVARKVQMQGQKTDVEYGYDGRRKGGKPLTMVQKAAKIIRKLSPKRIGPQKKRKNPETESEDNSAFKKSRKEHVHQAKTVFPAANAVNTSSDPSPRQLASLQMQLAVAKAEIQSLESKNRELSQQIETMETSVRAQVSDEMLQEMTDMRRRYESTIEKLKESFSRCEKSSPNSEEAASKVDELMEKVEECEQEMARMVRMHRSEIKELEEDHQAELSEKDKEIAELKAKLAKNEAFENSRQDKSNQVGELENELASSRLEIIKLKQSKEEMIKNYEKLLACDDDDEEDIDDDEEADIEEDHEAEDQSTPKTNHISVTNYSQTKQKICSSENIPKVLSSSKVTHPPSNTGASSGNDIGSAVKAPFQSTRKPFANLNLNDEDYEESESDSSFDSNEWLAPRRPTAKNPQTGLFARPPGRAPAAADRWDAKKGAWHLSAAI